MSAAAIIVLNAGSSSLKFSAYGIVDSGLYQLARGQIEGLEGSARFKVKGENGQILADEPLARSNQRFGHHEAFAHVARWLSEHYGGQCSDACIGHRVVHGGAKFIEPTLI